MELLDAMMSRADSSQVEGLSRFFKCGPGQYGEGDIFLGIKVPVTREVVKACWALTTFDDLEVCIADKHHEVRLAALLVLVEIFNHSKKDPELQERCVRFYLSHMDRINNWDLVDLSCYPLLGKWLLDKDRSILYELVRNGKTVWEQRIGIVSTMTFVRNGQLDDTYSLAQLFLDKEKPLHDLLQKAAGWLLREAGKRDESRLVRWLRPRASSMPRTMLRYSVEKLSPRLREELLHA
ncbi:MAG: DNA alkylation repair protein [Candidatus Cryptobacteroides sp.]